MWSSYHIYTEDRNYFLDKVSDILKEYPDVKFFFIQYIDPIGFHFRFRIQSSFQSKIEKMIYKLFKEQRVLKKSMTRNIIYLVRHWVYMRNFL